MASVSTQSLWATCYNKISSPELGGLCVRSDPLEAHATPGAVAQPLWAQSSGRSNLYSPAAALQVLGLRLQSLY